MLFTCFLTEYKLWRAIEARNAHNSINLRVGMHGNIAEVLVHYIAHVTIHLSTENEV